jgi:hypothetical protein
VAFLQIAVAKGNLASVAGIRVGSGGIHLEPNPTKAILLFKTAKIE